MINCSSMFPFKWLVLFSHCFAVISHPSFFNSFSIYLWDIAPQKSFSNFILAWNKNCVSFLLQTLVNSLSPAKYMYFWFIEETTFYFINLDDLRYEIIYLYMTRWFFHIYRGTYKTIAIILIMFSDLQQIWHWSR